MSEFLANQYLRPADAHAAREVLLQLASAVATLDGAHGTSDPYSWLVDLVGRTACDRVGIVRVPAGFKLSVVIPVFNEVATIQEVLRRVRTVGVPLELLVVDDGSLDGTRDLLLGLDPADDLKILLQDTNQGKGAALKCGFVESTGDIVAIQDGDLEYDPRDLRLLLPPLLNHEADVVYGSRFGYARELVSYYVHQRGNELITRLSNWRTKLPLTDVETCYKVVRGDWIRQIAPTLCERRFGVELELTAKLARMPGARFCERPISYAGRSFREGKKIGWRDAVRAMWCILKY